MDQAKAVRICPKCGGVHVYTHCHSACDKDGHGVSITRARVHSRCHACRHEWHLELADSETTNAQPADPQQDAGVRKDAPSAGGGRERAQ